MKKQNAKTKKILEYWKKAKKKNSSDKTTPDDEKFIKYIAEIDNVTPEQALSYIIHSAIKGRRAKKGKIKILEYAEDYNLIIQLPKVISPDAKECFWQGKINKKGVLDLGFCSRNEDDTQQKILNLERKKNDNKNNNK